MTSIVDTLVPINADEAPPVKMWRQRLKIFMSNKLAIVSCVYVVLLALACFLVPHLHPTNQTNQAIAFNTESSLRVSIR